MTAAYLDKQPELLEKWSKLNPMGRIGRPDELRGVVTWLASDASSFCTGSECVVHIFSKLSEVDLSFVSSILVTGGHHAW
jgi:NAD(P)-dependent dehydrogenase (short-subunit alcohol dehydrogenase family)